MLIQIHNISVIQGVLLVVIYMGMDFFLTGQSNIAFLNQNNDCFCMIFLQCFNFFPVFNKSNWILNGYCLVFFPI